ncbi:MAG: hypothetical protein IT269_08570, partial [Saprospiraceae bacterium]|nr:hypothetical protein [Saprospiraceae bacterium]
TVNPRPEGFSISGSGYCPGSANVLTYNGPNPGNWQYIWNNGLLGTSVTAMNPGEYYVRVINEFGCQNQSNELVILPGPQATAIPTGCHTRCNPDTLCLPTLPDIANWQWYLNGSPIAGATSNNFIAEQSGTYHAVLTDFYGCTAESGSLNLNLYTGYGTVNSQVWSDVNDNGMIDPADTLVSGIGVWLTESGATVASGTSGNSGWLGFPNVLSTDYILQLDPATLPPDWHVVIGQELVSLSGCDVTGNGRLLIDFDCQPKASALTLKGCPNESVLYNGVSIPTGTTQAVTFPLPNSCDSVVTVTVSPLAVSTGSENLRTCPGTTVTYEGATLSIGQTQQFTFDNYLGCDSVVTVTVSALPTSTGSETLRTCPGTTVTYEGATLSIGQTQQFTFDNYLGCDSVVTVTVSALPTSTGSENLRTCPGTTVTYEGATLSIGQTQQFTFDNYLGCDSVVTVTVSALPTSTGTEHLSACTGTTVMYNNTPLSIGQTQDFILDNYLGCDSVVTVTVTEKFPTSATLQTGVCPGETFTYQNQQLTGGQTKVFILPNAVGCDSIVTVVVEQYQSAASNYPVTICSGATFAFEGGQWPPGTVKDFTLQTSEGCDSIVTLVVSAYPAVDYALKSDPSCAISSTGGLTATGMTGGQPPYQFSLDGVQFQPESQFQNLAVGDYTVTLMDDWGCLYEKQASIDPLPRLVLSMSNLILPCDSVGVIATPTASGINNQTTYLWSNGATSNNQLITQAGAFWMEADNGCETVRSEANAEWADLAPDLSFVYVPNAMKPDAVEARNAIFKPEFAPGLTVLRYYFTVYDRWGNQLYESKDISNGWDALYRTRQMQPEVMVWYLEADIAICGRVLQLKRQGDVTVVR